MSAHSESFLTVRTVHTERAGPAGGEPLACCLPASEQAWVLLRSRM